MMLFALGLNHQTAPLPVRERVVFHVERMRDALAELTRGRQVNEAAILSTCNRTELYLCAEQPMNAAQWLAEYHRIKPDDLSPYIYTVPREGAVRHAFRVASGLDSMALGEPQILGQMKQAARAAESAGTLGTLLGKLFQKSFAVAKEVRTNTEFGAASVSMAAAAVKLAVRIFSSLHEQKVLFIGAGEMIELCATHFAAQSPARITVANRTVERGEALAHRFGGNAIELKTLGEHLHAYDIVVSCTASSLPILGKGLVPPGKFIPVLEQTGMILEVGRWALQQAAADFQRWRGDGLAPPRIAVNVSAIQLRQKDFTETVRSVMARCAPAGGKDGCGLDLEITESLVMEDIEQNIAKLKAVREMGFGVYVDDFGTGYSSLSYIARLPINALKIDRAFVNNMATNPDDMTIVSTIISLAHALNLSVVAEGVETAEQHRLLMLLKCDKVQGYLFSRPVPADQIVAMLSSSTR